MAKGFSPGISVSESLVRESYRTASRARPARQRFRQSSLRVSESLDNLQISAYFSEVRRKTGTLLPIELSVLDAGLDMQSRGQAEFHGYALAREMADRERARRLTGHGTLYRALDRLERLGFLECWTENPNIAATAGRPIRVLYRVSAQGERALAEARRSSSEAAPRLATGEL
jgi:DNA-binding PadR family transcriptional regulator